MSIAVILFVIAVSLIALSIRGRKHGLAALQQWAKREGFELVDAKRRSVVPHWVVGKGYQFFRISVRKQGNGLRRGWVRCRDFNHAEPHNIEVIWDERSA